MLIVELSLFFYLYLIFLVIFVLFFLIDLAHLINTGTITIASTLVTVAVSIFCLFILSLTWNFAQTVDWHTTVVIWDTRWISGIF